MRFTVIRPITLKMDGQTRKYRPGEVFETDSEKIQPFIKTGLVKPACQSFRWPIGGPIQDCGSSGWTCDRCAGPGDGLKTVYFWSERLGTMLDLVIPEKDLFDAERVINARMRQEEENERLKNK